MASSLFVCFEIDCEAAKLGENVFIVGSAEELGSWNPMQALVCTTTENDFPRWRSLPIKLHSSGAKLEFKALLQPFDHSAPGQATWECGCNRVVDMLRDHGEATEVIVYCLWEDPEVSLMIKRKSDQRSASARLTPGIDTSIVRSPMSRQVSSCLSPLSPMARQISSCSAPRRRGWIAVSGDGSIHEAMSRTPSMMLLDIEGLSTECGLYERDVEKLERERLNAMQRKMNSVSLLEEMKKITDRMDPSNTILLQGFNWESWRSGGGKWYGVVASKLDVIADLGVTDIWLPPPSQSVAEQGYLPSQLFNLDGSKYGSQADLECLLQEMHDRGIRGVADIVINHRCGDKQDHEGRWNQFSSGITTRPSFAGIGDWGGWAITLGDKFSDGTGENRPASFDASFDAAPDIDHANPKVQQSINVWLRWLRLQVGFDAWRFDFVKGYAAEFVGQYCKKSEPSWAVGELWGDMQYDETGLSYDQNKHRQDLANWVNATGKQSCVFDFTTKGILQEACRNVEFWRLRDRDGKPPGLIGWMPEYAVTFIDNHDTGSTQRHWEFPGDKVLVGYAYIITHPGIPALFWDHIIDWGEDHRRRIGELLKARRDAEISVDAPVRILCADRDLYLAEVGSPLALRVALGPRGHEDLCKDDWSMVTAGNGYCVWIRLNPKSSPVDDVTLASKQPLKAPSKSDDARLTISLAKNVDLHSLVLSECVLETSAMQKMTLDQLDLLILNLDSMAKAARQFRDGNKSQLGNGEERTDPGSQINIDQVKKDVCLLASLNSK